jgi:hypothetical protein
MTKIVKFQFHDASGQNLSGVQVKLSGNGTLQTNAEGLVQFLVDDAPALVLEANDKQIWTGGSADLTARQVFRQTDTGFSPA